MPEMSSAKNGSIPSRRTGRASTSPTASVCVTGESLAAGTPQTSLDALRKASETSYFKAKDALWVKLVSPDNGEIGLGGAASVQVSR